MNICIDTDFMNVDSLLLKHIPAKNGKVEEGTSDSLNEFNKHLSYSDYTNKLNKNLENKDKISERGLF